MTQDQPKRREVDRRDAAALLGLGLPLALTGGIASAAPTSAPAARPTGLYAGDHGIVGNGRIDETIKVQAFLDLCRANGGCIAYFGTMRVQLSGPLVSTVGIVFDPLGYGEADSPGFYVTGSGYTALTVTGGVADFNVTVAGFGEARQDANGVIVADTRPRVNGIAFGDPDQDRPLAASVIRQARAFKLAGFGVRHITCYDCTFTAISVEQCGTATQHAFEVAGSAAFNCSESVWVRLQVERSACRAIFIHPNTLSCVFGKVHSEGTAARRGDPAWQLGGACSYDALRLHAIDPQLAAARIVGQQATLTNLRVDDYDRIPVEVDATGGRVVFLNPIATLAPTPNQAGEIAVFGGAVNALRIGAGWSFSGTALTSLEIGFMGTGGSTRLSQCTVGRLEPQAGQTTGTVCISNSVVRLMTFVTATGRLARTEMLGGTHCSSPNGAHLAYQSVLVDASSTLEGDVTLDHCALRLLGTVDGDLTVVAAPQSLAGMDAVVTGTVQGWTFPQAHDLLGPHRPGMFCKNLGVAGGSVPGWIFAAGRWTATG